MTRPEKAGLGLIAAAVLITTAVLGAILVALFEGDHRAAGEMWARSSR